MNLAAGVLGVFLATEILMLGMMTLTVILHRRRPRRGWSLESLNPLNAFTKPEGHGRRPEQLRVWPTGRRGLGRHRSVLRLLVLGWVQSAAMYGEESREPVRKIIPRATMLSVVGTGVFYVIVSWSAIVGTGPENAVALAQEHRHRRADLLRPGRAAPGAAGSTVLFEFLLMTGSYACGMAFHNCASRYTPISGARTWCPGSAGPWVRPTRRHGSPYVVGLRAVGHRRGPSCCSSSPPTVTRTASCTR